MGRSLGRAARLWHLNNRIDGGHDKSTVHKGIKIKGLKPKKHLHLHFFEDRAKIKVIEQLPPL
jgi:hypothetical protein